jgi:uncharacterized protein YjiS (DUF1127 family)
MSATISLPASAAERAPSLLAGLAAWFSAARQVHALTNDLAPLSEEQRRDIGVGNDDIGAKVDAAMLQIELGRLGRIPR